MLEDVNFLMNFVNFSCVIFCVQNVPLPPNLNRHSLIIGIQYFRKFPIISGLVLPAGTNNLD